MSCFRFVFGRQKKKRESVDEATKKLIESEKQIIEQQEILEDKILQENKVAKESGKKSKIGTYHKS